MASTKFRIFHEYIHLLLHRDYQIQAMLCYDTEVPVSNEYLEWQANEGSSELLVPAKMLLKEIAEHADALKSFVGITHLKRRLAEKYLVTVPIIETRLESLSYEINQHLNGIPLNRV